MTKIAIDPSKAIDLTLTYHADMKGYDREIVRTTEKDGWNASMIHIHSHLGTHMDAPYHFSVSDKTIEELEIAEFTGKTFVVDIDIVSKKQLITLDEFREAVTDWEAGHGVLIRTYWSKQVGSPMYRDELPRISPELAHWLVSQKVNLLAVEAPSVADVNNLEEVTNVHHILLRGGVTIVEGLTNTGQLSGKPIFLIALPLKIKDGDGSPARVIAYELE